ncbi:hypothetical protein BGW36DRAFT_19406 [Talaromyces proteolyticus]|uniref:Uncharacterized protein n=1 Tax=Talaromyces proteolyticus TaxID=1131652 RepID=A0AAD4L1M6_9EURO|nr:uncharacterized protein BGW36DRAFT_19406 [Talaromyces proteolyticus]KAH8705903.1 hypothetical protein BGW36DRAFT_19406 [Talaromyces proteolyticus]
MIRSKKKAHRCERTQPYSMDRYRKALRLFGKSKSQLEKMGFPHGNLGNYLRSYNLRVRRSNPDLVDIESDDDSDETYLPKARSKRKQKRVVSISSEEQPSEGLLKLAQQLGREIEQEIEQQLETPLKQPSEQQALVTKLRLPSIRGKTFLNMLANRDIFSDLIDADSEEVSEPESVVVRGSTSNYEANKPTVRHIMTAFAHPLDVELGTETYEPCEFCMNFTFGMFGLGLKKVEVADYGVTGGLEELSGGHRSAGYPRTRICNVCCLDRLYMHRCAGHEISSLPGYEVATFDYAKAFHSLEQSAVGGNYKQTNPWCTLCLNPAFFRCNTEQLLDKFGRDVGPLSSQGNGCGLLLCEPCKRLMDANGNDLAKVIARIPASEVVRADADFLVVGSDLHRYFHKQEGFLCMHFAC